MKNIFLGRPIYWALLAAMVAALWAMGSKHLHTSEFNSFIFLILGLATACVLFVLVTYRKGERLTREPFEEE